MLIDSSMLPKWSRALYLFSEQPDRLADFANSFSETQRQSKMWLIQELTKVVKPQQRILIIGGWYGTYLIPYIIQYLQPQRLYFNEKDEHCAFVVMHTFGEAVHVTCSDAMADSSLQDLDVDVVINTSCEHMADMSDFRINNPECVYALQSANNDDDPGHINVSNTNDEFIEKTGITEVIFRGRMQLRPGKQRFMVIGKKP